MEIYARNVNDALGLGCAVMEGAVIETAPRGKRTLEKETPVITHYDRPTERVLFNAARDANPFLHFFESLWLLAGRKDLKFMEYLAPQFKAYSDDGLYLQGSYGDRWRNWYYSDCCDEFDQLNVIIEMLKTDPTTRRAVLAMWNPADDLLFGQRSKDIPCNTHVYFKLRENNLRMTVCCRSNDMIWGAYGANAVHFSMLHEYVASKVGPDVQVGRYVQVSDSFHVYLDGKEGEAWARTRDAYREGALKGPCPYTTGVVQPWPLGAGHPAWDLDMKMFFSLFDTHGPQHLNPDMFSSFWWPSVAVPMWNTLLGFRNSPSYAGSEADKIGASDWRLNVQQWIARHTK